MCGTLAMRKTTSRPFTILDGMIFLVALAVGMALVRMQWAMWKDTLGPDSTVLEFQIEFFVAGTVSILIPFSIAMVSLRLRRPRPSFRRMSLQPGCSALVAVAVSAIGQLISHIIVVIRHPEMENLNSVGGFWNYYMRGLAGSMGIPVLVVWTLCVFGRRFRTQSDWIECVSKAIAIVWLLLSFYDLFVDAVAFP
jgi:hypothetical protein